MKVNKDYYIYFGFKNTIMALVTGIIVGFLLSWAFNFLVMHTFRIYDNVPVIIRMLMGLAMPLTILCFIVATQYIIGSAFWGKRRGAFEYSFQKKLAENNDSFSQLGRRLKEINKELKNYGDDAANLKFRELMKEDTCNVVVYFQYAIFCENNGKGKEAIDAYEKALSLVSESEKALFTYVSDQINRVKIEGPSKCDVLPGSKFILY